MFKKLSLFLATFTLLSVSLPAKGDEPSSDLGIRKRSAVVRIVTGCQGSFTHKKSGKKYEEYKNLTTAYSGTGFFISPDGYIVTNAHLVSEAVCRSGLFAKLIEKISSNVSEAPQDVKDFLRFVTQDTPRATVIKGINELFRLEDNDFKQDTKKVQLSTDIPKTYDDSQKIDVDKIGRDYEFKSGPLSINQLQEGDEVPYGGKDVAIIKIAGVNAASTLKLSNSDNVREEDSVKVIGYPSIANTSLKSLSRASVTDGKISSLKRWANDVQALQLDVSVFRGSSGSPVLNKDGEVIGIIAGANENFERERVPFAVPVITIREFLRQAGVTSEQESPTDKLFKDGLDLYRKGEYQVAREKFEQIKRTFPEHSEVDEWITKAQQEYNKAADERRKWEQYMWPLLGVGGFVLLSGTYLLLVRNRTRGNARTSEELNGTGITSTSRSEPSPTRMTSSTVANFFRRSTVADSQPFLELKNPQGQVRRFYLRKQQHQFGRDRRWADLYLPDDGWEVISRKHAKLQRDGNDYRIFDAESSNKLLINGIAISEEGHLLQNEDELKIGHNPDVQVSLKYLNPGTQRPPAPNSAAIKQ